MAYSKITSVEIKNFMGYESGKIQFDESGVINIKGYNDSGKSAMLTACAVAMMDAYKQKQAKFIRFGEDYFGIVVSFDDGVQLIRQKYKNGNSLWELREHGDVLYTNKAGSRLTKVNGVPEPIRDYLGLCEIEENDSYLNFQSNKDPLLLVQTTGSDNYRVLHEVLKAEEIYRANAMINSDRNQINGEISKTEGRIMAIEEELEAYKGIDAELIALMAQKDSESDKVIEAGSLIKDVVTSGRSVMTCVDIPEVGEIDVTNLESMNKLLGMASEICEMKTAPEVSEIGSIDSLELVEFIKKEAKELSEIADIPKVNELDCEDLVALGGVIKTLADINGRSKEIKAMKLEENSLKKELSALVEESGIDYRICNNCGTVVVV